jgi:hypothetical protein
MIKNDKGENLMLDDGGVVKTPEMMIESAKFTQDMLQKIGSPWPQTTINPEFSKTTGFLPSVLIQPTINSIPNNPKTEDEKNVDVIKGKYGEYIWKDWRGQILTEQPILIKTEDRFKLHNDLPRTGADLFKKPYSSRDWLAAFGDKSTDYFKNGLQVIDGLTPIENPINGESNLRLSQNGFDNWLTPFELNDPVYFGFDIIFDAISSPLLNGSVKDFINNYSSINEISSKKAVYEEFKNQFLKFFRTNAKVSVDDTQVTMTKTNVNPANLDTQSTIFEAGKKSYFSSYVQKITGFDSLAETNKGDTFKYIPEWKKDFITITMREDTSLSTGALAHLYKLLYWSRPNGKGLIPENLLRFNCDIIVSEVRNMNRVRKAKETGNIEVIKDNVARWIYTLRDCQFWFDKLPVDDIVDMSTDMKSYENFVISIDFKYSSHKLERFVPTPEVKDKDGVSWGSYVGFDAGAIWKIGNSGARNPGSASDTSLPKFYTTNTNTFNQNGISSPYILSIYGDPSKEKQVTSNISSLTNLSDKADADEVKNTAGATDKAAEAAAAAQTPGQDITTIVSSTQVSNAIDEKSSTKMTLGAKSIGGLKNISSPFFDKMGSLTGSPLESIKGTDLNSMTGKFSSLINKPTSGFFDIRSSLKESINLSSIKTSFSLSSIKTSLESEVSNFKSTVKGSVGDIVGKYSNINIPSTNGFFDKMGALTGNPLESIKGSVGDIVNKYSIDIPSTNGFFDKMGALTGNPLESIKGSVGDIVNKYSNINIPSTNSFFDKMGALTGNPLESIKGSVSDIVGKYSADIPSANSFFDKMGALTGNPVESIKGSIDGIVGKYSNAIEIPKTSFFDIRSDIKQLTGNDTSSTNMRTNLLNKTLEKVYNQKVGTPSDKKSDPPTSNSFFDTNNQLRDFLGGNLGNII